MAQPITQWIRDNGITVEESAGFLVDESGNYLVDELGGKLLDSVSSDGIESSTAWEQETDIDTAWANVLGSSTPTEGIERVTAQGDTRVTAQGDTRVIDASQPNRETNTSWGESSEPATIWANSFEGDVPTELNRVTSQGATRVTAQGDTRVVLSQGNKDNVTSWTEDEYV